MPGIVVRCLSREEPPAGGLKGRVTQAIDSGNFDSANTDFYVCGSAAMVAECRAVLERKGARHVFFELY
jgi:NAD(P)H-flavin reductase